MLHCRFGSLQLTLYVQKETKVRFVLVPHALLRGNEGSEVRHRNSDVTKGDLNRPGVFEAHVTDRPQQIHRDLVLYSDDHVILDVPEAEISRRVVLENAQGLLKAPYILPGRIHQEVDVMSGPIEPIVVDGETADQKVPASGPVQSVT